MSDSNANGFYNKILSKEGITGLLLFMFATFLMGIIYQGQQEAKVLDQESKLLLMQIRNEEEDQTEILQDIRYALRQQDGLTLRTNAR